MATIKDIAKLSGYSIGTVSRVINNRPDVSPETREKIQAAIDELGFQPNSNAQQLKQTVPSGVTVIVRGAGNRFLTLLLAAVQHQLSEHDELPTVRFIGENDDEVSAAIRITELSKPMGFIFLGGSIKNFEESFQKLNVPSVLVSSDASTVNSGNLSSFTTDDYSVARFAIAKLIEQGHKNIGIIGGFPALSPEDNITKRANGARDELLANGLEFEEDVTYIHCALSSGPDAYEAAKELLRNRPQTTAVFAMSDVAGLCAMRAFADMGFKVPEDISVMGFDGIDYTNFTIPRLSSIKQDVDTLAQRAVEDLLIRVKYPKSPVHMTIPYSYTVGESIASPRKNNK